MLLNEEARHRAATADQSAAGGVKARPGSWARFLTALLRALAAWAA
jgi:hypothetical protein